MENRCFLLFLSLFKWMSSEKKKILFRHFLESQTQYMCRCLTSSFPYGISIRILFRVCTTTTDKFVCAIHGFFLSLYSWFALVNHAFTVAAVVCRHHKSWMKFFSLCDEHNSTHTPKKYRIYLCCLHMLVFVLDKRFLFVNMCVCASYSQFLHLYTQCENGISGRHGRTGEN